MISSFIKMPYLKLGMAIALVGVALITMIYIGSLKVSLSTAKSENIELQAKNSDLETRNADLIQKNNDWRLAFHDVQQIAGKCNQAVEKLELATLKAKNNALEAIKKNAAIYEARGRQINEAGARPANPTGECTASVALAKQDLRGKP
jgi:FtsZ-binding cell division protein ZapB